MTLNGVLNAPVSSTVVCATVAHVPDALDRWIWTATPGKTGRTIPDRLVGAVGSFSFTAGATTRFAIPLGLPPLVSRYETGAAAFAGIVSKPSAAAFTDATGVHAVFIENMTDPRLIEQIAEETGATVGGELYADALSAPDGPAPTYLAMMRHNIETIAAALR